MGTKQALRSKPALFFLITLVNLLLITFSLAIVDDVAKPLLASQGKDPNGLSTYLVFVDKPTSPNSLSDTATWYESFLPDKLSSSSSDHQERIIHSYKNVATGFAAKLTAQEVEAMKAKRGFISARVAKVYTPQTTHSPAFLGLQQNLGLWNHSELGKGVIIGVFDTGVTPLHPSFSDKGMPPPPAKWRGKCEFQAGCNNKLIGARNFAQDSKGKPPVDDDGHGTHTSSTAAGNIVEGASVFGNANGTAAGMAPLAHLAMYKVCGDGCFETDILAGLDAAIDDGVDVLSLSLGGESTPFYNDPLSVAAFAAVRSGMFVSCSAGNSGPDYFSLSNEAPWILTVGASTIDRRIVANAKTGNGKEYDGESLFQPKNFPSTTLFPLIYAGSNGNRTTGFCAPGSLKALDVKGKVVLCDRGGGFGRITKGQEVKDNGGAGMILANAEPDGFSTLADPHVLPATHVSYQAGVSIKAYINSTTTPTATILFKGTQLGDKTAPAITSFSSRGPNLQSPGILKPDIIGPGVSILAAWPVSVENNTNAKATFNIISGTSMSCPHLSGIAALLKSSHPDWSPAAIKSAIMTTADSSNRQGKLIIDETNNPADIFATGSGHVNPSKANDPGLVYDIHPDDYIPYLCGLNYTDSQVSLIVQHQVNCSGVSRITDTELNYPSFSLLMAGNSSQTYTRTVTNVGPASSSYSYELSAPVGVSVSITPATLTFSAVNQKATYKVTFSKRLTTDLDFSQGYIRWFSAQHSVTTPIVVIYDDGSE